MSNSVTSELNDETSLVQLGQSTTKLFYDWAPAEIQASSWNQFPTAEKPDGKYKFTSFHFRRNQDLKIINRQTYSILDWLGDIGGLFDALRILTEFSIAPLSAFALKQRLAQLFQPRTEAKERKSTGCLGKLLFSRKRDVDRSHSFVIRELDLVRMVRRLKMLVVASLVTLTAD